MAAAVALTGCSSADTDAVRERPGIDLVRITSDEQVTTPAVALLPDVVETKKILLAYDTLLAQCVEASGHSFGMTEGDRPARITEFVRPFAGAQPLGPVDPKRMATYGFHDPKANRAAAIHVAYTGERTPSEVIVECDTEVMRELGGQPPAGIRALILEAGKKAGSDPRRAGPERSWITCMADHGFEYQSDGDPIIEFAMNGMRGSVGGDPTAWGDDISAKEIAVANADAQCQQESRNIDTQVALLTAYENEALDAHAELVAQYKEYLDQLLDESAQVLAENPAPANRVEWDSSKGEGPPAG